MTDEETIDLLVNRINDIILDVEKVTDAPVGDDDHRLAPIMEATIKLVAVVSAKALFGEPPSTTCDSPTCLP